MGKFQIKLNLLLLTCVLVTVTASHQLLSHNITCRDPEGIEEQVNCSTACVNKFGMDRTQDIEGTGIVVRRYGCEGRMMSQQLENETRCDFRKSNGFTYEFVYFVYDEKTHSDLRITKICCWFDYCNNRFKKADMRYLYHAKSDIYKSLYRSIINSKVYFSLLSALSLIFILIFSYELFRAKTKVHRARISDYHDEIEFAMVEISEFDNTRIIDTRTLVSGQLTINEVSRVLAQFPDEDAVIRRTTTTSTESTSDCERRGVKNNQVTTKQILIQIEKPLLNHTAGYTPDLFTTTRDIATPRSLLYRLVEHGPYQFPFDVIELLQLFDEAYYIVQAEKSLLKVGAGCTIIGDIRGNYIELHRWLQLTGWPPNNKILFLGGIVDNNQPGSVETLALICALKCCFPKHVYILRGVPESAPFKIKNRFNAMVSRTVESSATRLFNNLSVAAIVGGSILAVYSGFSPFIRGDKSLENLEKPSVIDSERSIERDVIFNRPSPNVRMYRRNLDNGGLYYGNKAVLRALKLLDCQMIVRARNPVQYGFLPCWRNRLLTIYSVPMKGDKHGCVLSVSRDMHVTPIMIKSHHRPMEKTKRKRE